LALSSAEFVGKQTAVVRLEAHEFHDLPNPFFDRLLGQLGVNFQRLSHDALHPHPRTEGTVRVLEYRLHGFPVLHQVGLAHVRHILALEMNRPFRGSLLCENQLCRGGLAAARLSHHTQGLSTSNLKIDAVDSLNPPSNAA